MESAHVFWSITFSFIYVYCGHYSPKIVFSATAWNVVAIMYPGARPFCRLTGCPDVRLTVWMLIWNSSYSF